MKRLYFDHHTATPPSSQAIEAMQPFLQEKWETPTAPHAASNALLPTLAHAEKALFSLIEAPGSATFHFTPSGAAAINQVVWGTYLDVTRKEGKNHFVTSTLEEAPAMMAIERLQELGCVMHLATADPGGKITAQAIADSLTPRTALVSLSWACPLTGVIHPVKEIAQVCKERGLLFHVDATHVLGNGYFPWEECGADFLTFEGALLGAPRGTGGLFVRPGLSLPPLVMGDVHPHVAALVALSVAAQERHDRTHFVCTETARLRDTFEQTLLKQIPQATLLFSGENRLPHIACMAFPGVTSDALLYQLGRKGVLASFGGGEHQQIGLLLQACHVPPSQALTALSFALSHETTEEEVQTATSHIAEVVSHLRQCSAHLEVLT